LYVDPLNQDTDTIKTWRIVNDADKDKNRTISVLTKADLAMKAGKESLKKRIKTIVSGSKSSACFIVHGAAKDNESEEYQLADVEGHVREL